MTVISAAGAFVSVQNAKTRFGSNSRLTAIGSGANMLWNGVPMPALINDVSPPNFNMAAFTGGVPNNWAMRAGTAGSIANVSTGTVRLLFNSATTAALGYNLPASMVQKPGVYCVFNTMMYNGIANGRVTFHCRRNDSSNDQSIRVFDSFNHPNNWNYFIPIVVGYDAGGALTFDIEWSSPAIGSGAGWLQIANLAIYEWPDTMMKQDAAPARSCAGNSSTPSATGLRSRRPARIASSIRH